MENTNKTAGKKVVFAKWIEVEEINLGSIQKPNREILSYRFEPIIYEK